MGRSMDLEPTEAGDQSSEVNQLVEPPENENYFHGTCFFGHLEGVKQKSGTRHLNCNDPFIPTCVNCCEHTTWTCLVLIHPILLNFC